MPVDRPDARELVDTVRELLEQMLPSLSGYDAFQVRIAASLLGIAGRELESGESLRRDEHERLARLLGRDAPLEELEAELIDWIREGDLDERWAEILDFLRATAEARLRITNPKHLGAG